MWKKHARTRLGDRWTAVLRLRFEGDAVLQLEHKELRLVEEFAHEFSDGA